MTQTEKLRIERALIGRTLEEGRILLPNAEFSGVGYDGKFSEGEPRIIRASLLESENALAVNVVLSKFKVLK